MNYSNRSYDLIMRSNSLSTRTPFSQLTNYRDRSNEEMDWSDGGRDTSNSGVLSPFVSPYYPVSAGCQKNMGKNYTDSTSPTSLFSSLNIIEPQMKSVLPVFHSSTNSVLPVFHPSTSTPKFSNSSSKEFQVEKYIPIENSESNLHFANSRPVYEGKLSKEPSSLHRRSAKSFLIDEDVDMFDISNNVVSLSSAEIGDPVVEEVELRNVSDVKKSPGEDDCDTIGSNRVKTRRSCLSGLVLYCFLAFVMFFCAFFIHSLYFEKPACLTNINISVVRHELAEKVFGQHLAITALTESLDLFLRDGNEDNVLVLSFHGWTGIGKNHMSNILTRFFPPKNVHRFIVTLHLAKSFRDKDFENWVMSRVNSSCGIQLFILDEMDKANDVMISGFKHILRSMRKLVADKLGDRAIFLLVSNTGSSAINDFTADSLREGLSRESIVLGALIDQLQSSTQHTWYGQMIRERIIDRTIPFLPLERRHVGMCVSAALRSRGVAQSDDLIAGVLSRLPFFPPNVGTFSSTGCRKVNSELDLLLF